MDAMLMILIIGGGLAFAMIIVGLVVTARSERSLMKERLGRYMDEEVTENAQAADSNATPVGDWLNRRLEKSSLGGGIARDLARADLKLKAGEYVATMIIAAIGTASIFWYFGDRGGSLPIPVFTLVGFFIGLNIPRLYVRRQQGLRLQRFEGQLADMLNLMVNGLRAGYSAMQAMESVSKEMPPPISDEFRRVVQEMQLGISMETALDNLLRRIPSSDLDLVITAMNVQREVGGNLVEILDTISYTIRERVRVKGEIRVLTSQVLYSGRFLAIMPVLIAGVLWCVNKPYMMQFFNPETRIVGITALVAAVLMIGAGYFVMMKIANIEV
jgi:tight adherence protein B